MPSEGVEPSDQPPRIVVMAYGFTARNGEHLANLEAQVGVAPTMTGFAIPRLTTWLLGYGRAYWT